MKEKLSWFDRVMAAVTFAEANEPEKGKEFLTTTAKIAETEGKCRECDAILTTELHRAEVH